MIRTSADFAQPPNSLMPVLIRSPISCLLCIHLISYWFDQWCPSTCSLARRSQMLVYKRPNRWRQRPPNFLTHQPSIVAPDLAELCPCPCPTSVSVSFIRSFPHRLALYSSLLQHPTPRFVILKHSTHCSAQSLTFNVYFPLLPFPILVLY